MMTSFFDKTKPINYVVVLSLVVLVYVAMVIATPNGQITISIATAKMTGLLFLVLTFFVINPTLKADKLADIHSYALLCYGLFVVSFIKVFYDIEIVLSNFLILLSIDKTLALKFEKNTTNKIFEASCFVFASSLFVDWTLLFLAPIYFAVNTYSRGQLRNWLMPIASFVVFLLCILGYMALFDDWNLFSRNYSFQLIQRFVFSGYLGVLVFLLFGAVVAIMVFLKLGSRGLGRNLSLRILLLYLVLGVLLIFLTPELGVRAVVYTFFPVAVFTTNYFETIRKKKFKEASLIFIMLLALISVFFQLYQ